MNAPQLHPEHLFDKERDGTLTPEEKMHLSAHRRACASCAFAHVAEDDFRLGEAIPVSEEFLVAFDHRLPTDDRYEVRESKPASRKSYVAGRFARWQWVAACAALAITGSAAALASVSFFSRTEPVAAPSAPRPTKHRRATSSAASAAVAEPSVAASPLPGTPTRVRRVIQESDAPTLFRHANELRQASRDREAARSYQALIRQHPRSEEATTSRVILGRLMLYRLRSSRAALGLFNEYLATEPEGPLAPEARLHRAVAYQRLGQREAERRSWEELLAKNPGSVYADDARHRLEELR